MSAATRMRAEATYKAGPRLPLSLVPSIAAVSAHIAGGNLPPAQRGRQYEPTAAALGSRRLAAGACRRQRANGASCSQISPSRASNNLAV